MLEIWPIETIKKYILSWGKGLLFPKVFIPQSPDKKTFKETNAILGECFGLFCSS